jgi:hypothetical protein
MGRTLHGGLWGKLYLSMGRWGKTKVRSLRRVVYLFCWTCRQFPLPNAGSVFVCFNFLELAAAEVIRSLRF